MLRAYWGYYLYRYGVFNLTIYQKNKRRKNIKKVVDNCHCTRYTNQVADKIGDEHGILAQLGEHLPYKQGVTGSSPVGPILWM